MPWFKVDDKLHSHRKAAKAGEALALWVVAGSWAMDQLSDGFVPDYIAAKLMTRASRHAAALVAAGMWEPGEKDGDTGWWFHDWAEHQPTRESVQTKREVERDKKRRQRRTPGGQFTASPQVSPGDNDGTPQGTPEGVTPSRPDPTRPVVPDGTTKSGKRRAPETPLPDSWKPNDSHREYAQEHGLDLSAEAFRFRNHAIANDRRQRRWDATFTTWLSRAKDFAPKRVEQQSVDSYLDQVPEAWR